MSRFYRNEASGVQVPEKANRILHLILVAMAIIFIRLWYLEVMQYDVKVEAAQAPTRRIVIEPSRRATIRDRFGLPLAINKVQYHAAVNYSQIMTVPSVAYEATTDGKRVKRYKRREHIRQLAELLATELHMDADTLEDNIHAEAAFYDHAPYIIKKDISEREYYRLKMLEASWPGLTAQVVPKRHYPYGRVAGDIIGYMGAIDANTYHGIVHERKALQAYIRERDNGEDPPLPEGIESPERARRRLKEIEELAYSINDFVGQSGIEKQFEGDLRGYLGKRRYYVDSKGNYLLELPGQRAPVPGRGITLALSIELQQYAEQLLAINDRLRTTRVSKPHRSEHEEVTSRDPWIKGGTIVALDPNSGEVVAMASYPRFDPNDFVPSGDSAIDGRKKANIRRWFESDSYIAEMWDGKRPLTRELYDATNGFVEEEVALTWERYLSLMLYEQGDVVRGLSRLRNIHSAVTLQSAVDRLIEVSGQGNLCYLLNLLYQGEGHQPQNCPLPAAERERIEANLNLAAEDVEAIKKQLDPYLNSIKHTYDKVLLIDIVRTNLDADRFSRDLLQDVGGQTLAAYRRMNQAFNVVQDVVYGMSKELFHDVTFKEWRRANEKTYLKEKRREEALSHRYARPYTEYLNTKESELFQQFWTEHALNLVNLFLTGRISESVTAPFQEHFSSWYREIAQGAHGSVAWRDDYLLLQSFLGDLTFSMAKRYLATMRSFQDLNRPLYGRYRHLKKQNGQQFEKHLAGAFYPTYGYGYGRSLAYRQATPQGSIFKIVTAYEALAQRYRSLKTSGEDLSKLNPLRMIDQPMYLYDEWIVGYTMDHKPIPQQYKGGILPKTQVRNIGEVDVVRAIEVSSNSYFALLASDHLAKPTDLADAAKALSLGQRTGIALPGEISGRVPTDLEYNRSGLYDLSIGQHSLVVTPLQTSIMLAALSNGGKVLQPKIVNTIGGIEPSKQLLYGQGNDEYRESLLSAGIDFPLFLNSTERKRDKTPQQLSTTVTRQLFLPGSIRSMLLEGMYRVAHRHQTSGLWRFRETYHDQPEAVDAMLLLKDQIVGKTSTAESVEGFGPDRQVGTLTYNHIWFGSIIFDPIGKQGEEIIFRDSYGKPELVVVVYLRYGTAGRDAIPLAAQVAAKWRHLKEVTE